MKNKVRLQKGFILFFMTFAVFSYNNCELSNTSNEEEIESGTEEIGVPKSGGSDTTPERGDIPKSGGSDKDSETNSKSGGSTDDGSDGGTSTYDLKLEAYTGSNLHSYLVTGCNSCHKGDYYKGGHGDEDVVISMNDLLYYGYVNDSTPYGKVNFDTPEESLLYVKALTGHQGANASTILDYINEWIAGYNQLLEESTAVVEEEEEVVVESDIAWRSIEDLTIISSEATLPTTSGLLNLEIDSNSSMSIEVVYDSEQGLYLLKSPTITRTDGKVVHIKEMRSLINDQLFIQYGTWSSIDKSFSSGDIVGSGVLFIDEIDPGNDKLKFGFVEYNTIE